MRKLPVLIQQWILKHGIKLSKILLILTVIFYALLGIWIFIYIPDDYLQGRLVKIMYIHVPCAWISTISYCAMALSAFAFLISRIPFYDIIGEALAKISLNATAIALITGAIWGKPTWGTWWVWDARLTSVLAQFFLLLVYYMIRNSGSSSAMLSYNNRIAQQQHKPRGRLISFHSAQLSSIMAIVGVINVPIIKLSVYLWHSLHQTSSVFTSSGVRIDSELFSPLIVAFIAISLFYITIFLRALTKVFGTRSNVI